MSLLSGWISRLTEHAKEEISETVHGFVFYALAGIAALAALVLVTMAIYWWLEQIVTPVSAALILAGLYAVVAVILSVIAANQKTGHVHSPETAMAMQATSGGDFKQLDTAATMGVDLEEVAQTLATAGYRAESLAVTVASGVAQQLSPVQFVCLVFVGSFFFGRRLRR